MDMWDYAAANSCSFCFISVLAVLATWCVITSILVQLPSRIMRHLSIRKHGWPPEHCDADGDFREDDD